MRKMPSDSDAKAAVTNRTPPGNESAGGAQERRSQAKVMVVDDDPLMTAVVQTHLEEQGYRHSIATNDAATAFERVQRERPDVLLLDLMMPGRSGFEILAAIRADERTKTLPVIVLTAAAEASAKAKALELGASAYLSKPIDVNELVAELDRLAAPAVRLPPD